PRRRVPQVVRPAARQPVRRRGGHGHAPHAAVAQRRDAPGPRQRPRPARGVGPGAHVTRRGASVTGGGADVPRGVVDPLVWPSGTVVAGDGSVSVAGVDLRVIAREHGTPAYVLDEADFRRRARSFRDAFTEAFAAIGTGVDVYYAGKALLTVAVARWAHEEGLRIDTATGGE